MYIYDLEKVPIDIFSPVVLHVSYERPAGSKEMSLFGSEKNEDQAQKQHKLLISEGGDKM